MGGKVIVKEHMQAVRVFGDVLEEGEKLNAVVGIVQEGLHGVQHQRETQSATNQITHSEVCE